MERWYDVKCVGLKTHVWRPVQAMLFSNNASVEIRLYIALQSHALTIAITLWAFGES